MGGIQSVKSWYGILKWDKLPNFSSCHHADTYKEFEENYYCCGKLVQLEENLLETLNSGNNTASVRLTGVPGSGKTSFIYHLMRRAKANKDKVFSKYVFYVFHANKANDADYLPHTRQEIIFAWETLYSECGEKKTFEHINDRRDLDLKGKLNALVKYYKDNRGKFRKTLIFIIDDVDLLKDDLAYKIANAVKTDLELQSVIKWVSIRGVTFDHYKGETKNFFEQFFPSVYNVPDTSVRDIVQYRIDNATNKKGKNPFSSELCDLRVNPLFDGNKRRSLAILKSILEDNLPKEIKEYTDEEFIQNYLDRVAVNTFITKGALPNIHLGHLRSLHQYPLPMDIILCLQYTASPHIVVGTINEIMQTRCRKSREWDISRKLQVRSSDFQASIEGLKNENLIFIKSSSEYRLTNKGKILAKYLENPSYIDKCLSGIPVIDKNLIYDDFAKIFIDYEKTVNTFISWIDAHSPKSNQAE
ncbi:MAG: NACHT domain-containing protein [Deltaproteobacteria bacterium]|nr:NACHT domain-containing protein [Deltaproteobacteria bacterium]